MVKGERLAYTFTAEQLQKWKDEGVKVVYAVVTHSPERTIVLYPQFEPKNAPELKTYGINDATLDEYSKGIPNDYSIAALPMTG